MDQLKIKLASMSPHDFNCHSLNGDSVDEVIFAAFETQPNTPENYTNTAIQIFGWQSGVFQNLTETWLPNCTNSVQGVGDVAFGDFDGNGLVDVFLSAYTDMEHPVNAYALMNQGNSFEVMNLGLELWMHAVASGDINGDGYDDVVPTGYSVEIPTYLGSPNGLIAYSGMMGGSGITLGDFLSNGSVTAIFVDAGDDVVDTKLVQFRVNEQEGYTAREVISVLPSPRLTVVDEGNSHDIRARTLDFNDDGLDDVLVFSYQYATGSSDPHRSEIQFLQNLGEGGFLDVTDDKRIGYDVSAYVGYTPQIIDVNLDGRPDVFTSNRDWLPEYRSTTLLLQNQESIFVDTGKAGLLSAVGSEGQAVIAQGPNNQMFLISESAWSWGSMGTDVFVQEILFPERDVDESLSGTLTNNSIFGFAGNDQIFGKRGDDFLDGGVGIDRAVYAGHLTEYAINGSAGYVMDLQPERDGLDTLVNIERLQFADTMVGLDVGAGGNTGEVYRLYLTVLGRNPEADPVGCGFWIDKLDREIMSTEQMVGYFLDSTEFVTRFGASSSSNESFVNLMYLNLLGRDGHPDSGFEFWCGVLDNNYASREQVAVGFMESPENISNAAPLIGEAPTYQHWLA